MTVNEKIQSMIAKSNQTTGFADTDLTSAITNLCNGYGGGDTPVFYTPTPASGINSVYGKIVKTGHKVTWIGQVYFTSLTSGDKHIFTLPADIRPYTKYLFKCGSDNSTTDDIGYILPNGEVHTVLNNSKSYTICNMSFDIITPDYNVTVDTSKITSHSGGIEKVGNLAIMQVSFTVSGIPAAWHSNILNVPSGVRPLSEQCPFSIYRVRNSAQYLNTWIGANGNCDIYINPTLGTTIDMIGMWEI